MANTQTTPPNTPVKERSDLLVDTLFSPQTVQIGDLHNSPVDNVRRVIEISGAAELYARRPAARRRFSVDTAPLPLFCEMLYLTTDLPSTVAELERAGSAVDICGSTSTLFRTKSADNVLLADDGEEEVVELEELKLRLTSDANSVLCWRQISRWIKYQQQVDGDGTRLSRPHISLLTVHALLQLKKCLRDGVVQLDMPANNVIEVFNRVVDGWRLAGFFAPGDDEQLNLAKDVLYAPKLHLVRGKMRKINEIPCDDHFNAQRRSSRPSVFDSFRRASFVEDCGSSDDEEDDPADNADERLLKRLPSDTDAAVILVANVSALKKTLSTFVRLSQPTMLYPEMPDHPVPVRFLFVLLCPSENYAKEASGIGRAMGALFSDEVFERVAYTAKDKATLADAVEEFFSQIVAVPPGKCDTEARWEPHDLEITSAMCRTVGTVYADYAGPVKPGESTDSEADEQYGNHNDPLRVSNVAMRKHRRRRHVLYRHSSTYAIDETKLTWPAIFRTGHCFGGLIFDIRRKKRWYYSDFVDFFETRLSKCLAATMTIFFANLAQILTFAGIMERALQHQIAAMENIVSGGLCGVIFGFFAGQPLNILSVTGPTLVFEKILFDFCTAYNWEYLPFRFYVGIWIVILMLILVATDASALVGLITRFTEEAFMALIALVFIIQSFEKLYEISYEAPSAKRPEMDALRSTCRCLIETTLPSNGSSAMPAVAYKNLSIGIRRCRELGGIPQGYRCYFKPDVYLLSVLLTFGTFAIVFAVNRLRHSHYFTFKIRTILSDFSFLIAIVIMTILTNFIGLDIPSIKLPASLRPTLERDWLVDVTAIAGLEAILFAFLPAFFYTILLVMDQQITAVIVNRPSSKLKKGGGYHLDLFIIMLLILMCSLLGLPFYVAATLLSTTHLNVLKFYSYSCVAPGVSPKFLGVMEQRVSAILSHLLIGFALVVTPLLKLIPLPVLTGIFLYMGVVSLFEQQLLHRISLIFVSEKYLPEYKWLRGVPMKRVHLFTTIQVLSFVVLLAIKYASTFSMVFPIMLIVMVLIRIHVLQRIFSEAELRALDDELPSFADVWRPRSASDATDVAVTFRPERRSKWNDDDYPADGGAAKLTDEPPLNDV